MKGGLNFSDKSLRKIKGGISEKRQPLKVRNAYTWQEKKKRRKTSESNRTKWNVLWIRAKDLKQTA